MQVGYGYGSPNDHYSSLYIAQGYWVYYTAVHDHYEVRRDYDCNWIRIASHRLRTTW